MVELTSLLHARGDGWWGDWVLTPRLCGVAFPDIKNIMSDNMPVRTTPKTSQNLATPETALVTIAAPGISLALPALIGEAGESAARHTLEFFTARIPNPNTRAAYGRAVARFCRWCEQGRGSLAGVTAPAVAAYLEEMQGDLDTPSVKVHLAGLRHWLDWLTQKGVLPVNPAASVRGPRHVVCKGKTPVLERDEARRLFDSMDDGGGDVVMLRDRAIVAVMLFGFARVGAVVKMRVRDFEDGQEASLVFREKGGKQRRIPCHHLAREYLRAYLVAAALEPDARVPLFQTAPRHSRELSGKAMRRTDAWAMVKRRCQAAGLPAAICNHSFRATGITIHQENGGRIEDAQELAGHASTRTTQLYNRKLRTVARAEVERVQL
jgi:site-specific recombinase XerD